MAVFLCGVEVLRNCCYISDYLFIYLFNSYLLIFYEGKINSIFPN